MRKLLELIIVIFILCLLVLPIYGTIFQVQQNINNVAAIAEENRQQQEFEIRLLRNEISNLQKEVRQNE